MKRIGPDIPPNMVVNVEVSARLPETRGPVLENLTRKRLR